MLFLRVIAWYGAEKFSLKKVVSIFTSGGDMSLIGPRPLLVKYLPYYTEREHLRHSIRPGLTGYAQVHGRNKVTWFPL